MCTLLRAGQAVTLRRSPSPVTPDVVVKTGYARSLNGVVLWAFGFAGLGTSLRSRRSDPLHTAEGVHPYHGGGRQPLPAPSRLVRRNRSSPESRLGWLRSGAADHKLITGSAAAAAVLADDRDVAWTVAVVAFPVTRAARLDPVLSVLSRMQVLARDVRPRRPGPRLVSALRADAVFVQLRRSRWSRSSCGSAHPLQAARRPEQDPVLGNRATH